MPKISLFVLFDQDEIDAWPRVAVFFPQHAHPSSKSGKHSAFEKRVEKCSRMYPNSRSAPRCPATAASMSINPTTRRSIRIDPEFT